MHGEVSETLRSAFPPVSWALLSEISSHDARPEGLNPETWTSKSKHPNSEKGTWAEAAALPRARLSRQGQVSGFHKVPGSDFMHHVRTSAKRRQSGLEARRCRVVSRFVLQRFQALIRGFRLPV